jgi:hypothetical protein
MATQKTRAVEEGKEFWVSLGQEIGASRECAKALTEKLEKFMTNDHAHLAADVKELRAEFQKLAVRIATIVGGITAVSWVIMLLVRLWK